MPEEGEYILGVDAEELERLRAQHEAWRDHALALFETAGLGAGQSVLDLGCGPGFTSFELAQVVGPLGRVIASDQSAGFLEFLTHEGERLGLGQIEASLGPVEEIELEPESLDATYARWLFCWLPDAGEVLRRVAAATKPGGCILVQDYIDWGAMKLIPTSTVFQETVVACLNSWLDGGVEIDVAERIPDLAASTGLDIEHFLPLARIGGVGSLEWEWLGGFFRSYLPRLVERGLLTAEQHAAHQELWQRRAASGRVSLICTPTLVDVVLRKPLG